MNTAVLKIHWLAALFTWLHKPARSRVAKPMPAAREKKPSRVVRIAGLR